MNLLKKWTLPWVSCIKWVSCLTLTHYLCVHVHNKHVSTKLSLVWILTPDFLYSTYANSLRCFVQPFVVQVFFWPEQKQRSSRQTDRFWCLHYDTAAGPCELVKHSLITENTTWPCLALINIRLLSCHIWFLSRILHTTCKKKPLKAESTMRSLWENVMYASSASQQVFLSPHRLNTGQISPWNW